MPEEFQYIVNHSGAKVVCAHSDYLQAVDGIRGQLSDVEHFVALEGSGDGWLDYEALLGAHEPDFVEPEIGENDLLTINYTSGTPARPKGVMITHRNSYMNVMGILAHHHLEPGDRYLWTLPMFHANGWTFTWLNTARGMAHVCLRQVEPTQIFRLIREEYITMFCAAPTVLIGIANAPEAIRAAAIRDGWFHSGDAAVVHPDGYVEIRDRFKDVIISGGENISSVEVEGCLLRHAAVQEVAVVGMPHERWGESPHAFVVLREGAEATGDELKLHVRENLAHFKTPQWVSFVVDLPKTATGEVQKFVLRGGQSAIARQ